MKKLKFFKKLLIAFFILFFVSSFCAGFITQAAPNPYINSIGPANQAPIGGIVTIYGINFGSVQGTNSAVIISNGAMYATVLSWSNNSIDIQIPGGATNGNVQVINGGIPSNGYWLDIDTSGNPHIYYVAPDGGAIGSTVTITGYNLGNPAPGTRSNATNNVSLNGTWAAEGDFISWSDTQIQVNVPAGATSGGLVVTSNSNFSNPIPFSVNLGPYINSLFPNIGGIDTAVTISGFNFGAVQGGSTVTFNSTVASVSSWSDTQISVTVPTGATSGGVVVTVGGNPSNNLFFNVDNNPYINNISPEAPKVGEAVTISGYSFGASQGGSTVTFNGVDAGLASSWSQTEMTINIPAAATSGPVVVTVGGTPSNEYGIQIYHNYPSIEGISPPGGATGSTVWIEGKYFDRSQGVSTVSFNGVDAGAALSWSDNAIQINVPAGVTSGNVVVNVSGVRSNGFWFVVDSTPHITNLSPAKAAIGGWVSIHGYNFGNIQSTSTVTFNGVPAIVAGWGTSRINAFVPIGATSGNVIVQVAGVGNSNPCWFTVDDSPYIEGIWPTVGKVGDNIGVRGNNFGNVQGTSTVTFAGPGGSRIDAGVVPPWAWSNTQIQINVPAGAVSGNIIVIVNSQESNYNWFNVSINTKPRIIQVWPNSGEVGEFIGIQGYNFGFVPDTVLFNGVPATVLGWSDNFIQVTVPAGATTGDLVVKVGTDESNGYCFNMVGDLDHVTVTSAQMFGMFSMSTKINIISGASGTIDATSYDKYGRLIKGASHSWSIVNPAVGTLEKVEDKDGMGEAILHASTAPGYYPNAIEVQSTYNSITKTTRADVVIGDLDRVEVLFTPDFDNGGPPVSMFGSNSTITMLPNSEIGVFAYGVDINGNYLIGDINYQWSVLNSLAGRFESAGQWGLFASSGNLGSYPAVLHVEATQGSVSKTKNINVNISNIDHIMIINNPEGYFDDADHPFYVLPKGSFNPGMIAYDSNNNRITIPSDAAINYEVLDSNAITEVNVWGGGNCTMRAGSTVGDYPDAIKGTLKYQGTTYQTTAAVYIRSFDYIKVGPSLLYVQKGTVGHFVLATSYDNEGHRLNGDINYEWTVLNTTAGSLSGGDQGGPGGGTGMILFDSYSATGTYPAALQVDANLSQPGTASTPLGNETIDVVITDYAIKVLSPNGGENWDPGSTHQIQVAIANPLIMFVGLRYSTDGGNTFTDIDPLVRDFETLMSSSFTWNIPTGISTNQVRVRVLGYSFIGGYFIAEDMSDSNFSIGYKGPSGDGVTEGELPYTGVLKQ
jgi:hypothetical protein